MTTSVVFIIFGSMIDKNLLEEYSYSDFMPIFKEFFDTLDKLDARELRLVIGDRLCDRLEDAIIRVVYKTYQNLEENEC